MSQAGLAEDAEVSPRHLSCLETGKAHPSRQMVLVLTSALDLPLRERNTLLHAAGYAAAYRETDLNAPEMHDVKRALSFLLRQSEPYGAVVVDRHWDLLMMNGPMETLSQLLLGTTNLPTTNMMRFLFEYARPFIENFDEVASETLQRLHREAVQAGDDGLYALYESLASLAPPRALEAHWSTAPSLLIPVVLAKGGLRLSLFTTLTTLGTPQDITLSELRIESYFPADDASEQLLRTLGGS